jgi:hypothetical protein
LANPPKSLPEINERPRDARVNARGIFEGWVVLSALNVLDTFTAVICYCNKTCTFALALNFNPLVRINYD